jgi:hypothetical protein
MERMLVIVFGNEGKAYEGARALREPTPRAASRSTRWR